MKNLGNDLIKHVGIGLLRMMWLENCSVREIWALCKKIWNSF